MFRCLPQRCDSLPVVSHGVIAGALLLCLPVLAHAECDPLPQPDGPVHALVTDTTGTTLYFGGDFTTVGGVARDNIAAISLETCELTGWEPTANGEVRALWLAEDDGLIFVGGDFTVIGGENADHLAAVQIAEPGVYFPEVWDPPAPNGPVYALIPSETGQTLYVAGAFTTVGNTERHGFVGLTRGGGNVTGATLTLDEGTAIHTLERVGNRLYFGGDFTSIRVGDDDDPVDRMRAAAIDLDARELLDWAPAIDEAMVHVLRLAPDGSRIYAGTDAGVHAFDSVGGEAIATWQPQVNGAVHALLPSFDRSLVYLGGDFDTVNGVARANLAAVRAVDASLVDDEVFDVGGAVIRSLERFDDPEANDGAGVFRLFSGGLLPVESGNDNGNGAEHSPGGHVAVFTAAPPEQEPPLTTAQPAGGDGPFNSQTTEPVTLTCDDFGGSGCAATHYTTDGSEPDTGSSIYTGPIALNADMTLRFFSVDHVGNREAVRTEVYEVESTPPSTTASPPSRVFESREMRVTLTCSDAGSGCAATYYTTDGSRPTTDSNVYENPIVLTGSTVLRFFSVDAAGNNEGVQREEYVRNRGEPGAVRPGELLVLLAFALGWWQWRRRRRRA